MIFAADEPITSAQIAKVSGLAKKTVENTITELNEEYIDTRRCFKIEQIASGYRMLTLPEYHQYINRIKAKEKTVRLSQAALEALAVIAYKQPVTRVDIERIRGVDCGGVLKNLMSKELVVIDGKSPAPGNPLLYKTSEYFLEFFGLPSIEHLPPLTEIEDFTKSMPTLKMVKSGEDAEANESDAENESVSVSDEPNSSDDMPDEDNESAEIAETNVDTESASDEQYSSDDIPDEDTEPVETTETNADTDKILQEEDI